MNADFILVKTVGKHYRIRTDFSVYSTKIRTKNVENGCIMFFGLTFILSHDVENVFLE